MFLQKGDWEVRAVNILEKSLADVPQELNELDWKQKMSPNNKKLSFHLAAFANNPGGGILAYGIDNTTGTPVGVEKDSVTGIVDKLARIARDSIPPVVSLDHTTIPYAGVFLLLIYIRESSVKPVHLASGTIEDAYIRSGGNTRRASRTLQILGQ